jgi:hypothetical protein
MKKNGMPRVLSLLPLLFVLTPITASSSREPALTVCHRSARNIRAGRR